MKSKLRVLIASLLAGSMLVSSAWAASFPDVSENADYAEAVDYVSDQGFIVGDSAGNFNPEKIVTRAQMAVIICRMLGETENLTVANKFSDVPVTHWANSSIAKAAELGIISGYSDGTFRPDNTVTYEQAVTMVIRALDGAELATEAGGYPDGFLSVANEHGFLKNIRAKKGESLSRGDVASLVYNCAYFSFAD